MDKSLDIWLIEKMELLNLLNLCEESKSILRNEPRLIIATSSINAIFAPPTGSAYSASKAAIAKAFESLSLTYFNTGLRFSVVYPGPVDTAGLKAPRKLPFTWTAEKMGRCMVDFALSEKSSCEPFFFYKVVTRFLRALPAKYTMKLWVSYNDNDKG